MSEPDIRTILKEATAHVIVAISALKGKNNRLREYVMHKDICKAHQGLKCNCGLDVALEEIPY